MEFAVPCYRCGARQTDPDREASPWRRAVQREEQVLVCPECQESSSWLEDVDSCPVCGSPSLSRRLGQTVCGHCDGWRSGDQLGGYARVGHLIAGLDDDSGGVRAGHGIARADDGNPGAGDRGAEAGDPDARTCEAELSREVAEAIDRVLGRSRTVTAP